jgi:hypothetical protein
MSRIYDGYLLFPRKRAKLQLPLQVSHLLDSDHTLAWLRFDDPHVRMIAVTNRKAGLAPTTGIMIAKRTMDDSSQG